MSNETKRDVLVNAVDALADAQASSDNNVGLGHQDADLFMAEYDAALPDDLPVIPEAVGEYIQKRKAAYDSLVFALTARSTPNEVYEWMCTVTGDPDTELSKIEYVKQQDTFARAWVLGTWRVEETDEIVKLEAEK